MLSLGGPIRMGPVAALYAFALRKSEEDPVGRAPDDEQRPRRRREAERLIELSVMNPLQ
jgi:hypothetical protein